MCMNETFVKQPNLPAGRVTLAAVSGAFPEIPDALEAYGVACIRTEADPRLQPQIAHHADMQIFHLDQNRIFVLKGEQALRKRLEAAGFAVGGQLQGLSLRGMCSATHCCSGTSCSPTSAQWTR